MGGDPEVDDLVNECEAVVHNASEGPIFDIELRLLNMSWVDDPVLIDGCTYFALQPESSTEPETLGELGWDDFIRAGNNSLRWPLEIEFTDASGRRWRREPTGKLLKGARTPRLRRLE